ncbi:MAG: prolyl oligopeptidase family serine peptidase [Candidatus Aminicenantales bacterium]
MRKRSLLGVLALACLLNLGGLAQEPYKLPPKDVVDIVTAPPTPRVLLDPGRDTMLLIESESMPSIADLSQPLLRIAGMRITPMNNSRQVLGFGTGLTLKSVKDGAARKIELPAGAKLSGASWSNDGRWIAFARYLDNGVELWVVEAVTGRARAVSGPILNMVMRSGIQWLPDNKHLLVPTVVEGRGPAPQAPRIPIGPDIQVSGGKPTKVATYQDLLKNAFDEKLFEYYAASQLVAVDAASGETAKIGAPAVFAGESPSPDGRYFLVEMIKHPYSYSVPASEFAHVYEIWDAQGRPLKRLADLPPAEGVPMNGVPTGMRFPGWWALKPAILYWVEALDGGDPEKDAPFRDRVLSMSAPFSGEPVEIFKTRNRFAGFTWLAAPGTAFATETDWKKRWRTTWMVDLDHPGTAPRKLFDLNTQDAYSDPGQPVMTLKNGDRVVLQDKDAIYLSGQGASPKGDHPFLERMNLKNGKKDRLFECADGKYQSFVGFAGENRDTIIISHESKTEPPNYRLYDLRAKTMRALTEFKDPAPQLTGIRKDLIKYKRADGVELSGTLYLPPNRREGERLPVVIWAYPMEYGDASTAGQVRGSVDRFTFYRGTSELLFVTQGYAVLDNATMPVVGDSKTMNDTFIPQIVANARAAIETLDKMGVADPRRVGVGGHSYGAFMTANLLAHCDLFAAGIARSGAYNRTLTPFGFQNERRSLWEAQETYIKMSPFMYANQIKAPILMIHGQADDNSGTFPIQSERLFAALKGFGATARFVYLPYEAHGYSARESVLTVLAEMFDWFDQYVKNRK